MRRTVFIAVLICAACCSLARADTSGAPTNSATQQMEQSITPYFPGGTTIDDSQLFNGPGTDDMSYQMLVKVFGDPIATVRGLIPGGGAGGGTGSVTSATAVTNVVRLMGLLALFAGAGIAAYVLVVGTMNTAKSGVFLEKWDSAFVPLRVAGSFIAITPNPIFGGFSLAQAAVLLVALMGVSMANVAAGVFYQLVLSQPLITYTAPGSSVTAYNVGNIVLGAETCQALRIKNGLAPAGNMPVPTPTVDHSNPYVTTPSYSLGDQGVCGYVSISIPAATGLTSQSQMAGIPGTLSASLQDAFGALWGAMGSVAVPVADYAVNSQSSATAPAPLDYATLSSTYASAINAYQTAVNNAIGTAYASGASPGARAEQNASVAKAMSTGGWALLGGYFVVIEAYQDHLNALVNAQQVAQFGMQGKQMLENLPGGAAQSQTVKQVLSQIVQQAPSGDSPMKPVIDDVTGKYSQSFGGGANNGTEDSVMRLLSSFTSEVFDKMQEVWNRGGSGDASPLLKARTMGMTCLDVLMGSAAVNALWGKISGSDEGSGSDSGHGFLAWLLSAVMMLLGAAGVLLAYVLPSLPAFIWFFAVLTFLIHVFEGLVASPFWLAVHGVPTGGEISGGGTPGYRLVVTMLLRPLLLVLGFVGGMAILHVMAWFINYVFMDQWTLSRVNSFGNPLSLVVPFLLYALLQVLVCYRCVTLPFEFPGMMLRWSGLSDDTADVHREPLGELRNLGRGVHGGAGQLLSGGGRGPA